MTDGPDDGDIVEAHVYDAIGNVLESTSSTGTPATIDFTRDELDQVVAEARPTDRTPSGPMTRPATSVDACTWAAGDTVSDCLPVGTAGWTNKPTTSTSTRWDARNGRIGLTELTGDELTRTTVYDPDKNYAVIGDLPADRPRPDQGTPVDLRIRRPVPTDDDHPPGCARSRPGTPAAPTTDTGTVTYEYDDSDNRSHVVENNGNASTNFYYCHDARNQLIGRGSTTVCGTSSIETFAYDDSGNRTQAVEAGVTRNFAYTAAGLLCDVETGRRRQCAPATSTPTTPDGSATQGGWHFDYDAEARLVSACDGRRLRRIRLRSGRLRVRRRGPPHGDHRDARAGTPDVEWTFRYQGDAIVAEYKDGTLHREYVTDDTGTISKVIVPSGADAGDYLVDLERPRRRHGPVSDRDQRHPDPGQQLPLWHVGPAEHDDPQLDRRSRLPLPVCRAADVQWDAAYGLDLLYMHARHYSPSLGRFLQPDPSRLDAQLFVYGENGPITNIDPGGTYKINPVESEWCRRSAGNAARCLDAKGIASWAHNVSVAEAKGKPVDGGTKFNAFKHCCWAAAMTNNWNSITALGFLDRHEWGDFQQPSREYRMDKHNNKVGAYIGSRIPHYYSEVGGQVVRNTPKERRLIVDRCKRALSYGVPYLGPLRWYGAGA